MCFSAAITRVIASRPWGFILCLLLSLFAQAHVLAAPVVVSTTEVWDGVQNPHAAQGVVLSGSGGVEDPFTYTLPDGLQLTATGLIRFTAPADFRLAIGGAGLTMANGSAFDLNKAGERNTHRVLTLAFSGGDLLGQGQVITTDRGAHQFVIRGVRDVQMKAINLRRDDAAPAPVLIDATGAVTISGAIDTRDISAGGNAGGQVLIRAPRIDVAGILTGSNRTASAAPNGFVNLTALGAPGYDAGDATANGLNNTLILRGQINTRGMLDGGSGDILLQGVKVQLQSGFSILQYPGHLMGLRAGRIYAGTTAADVFTDSSGSGLTPDFDIDWQGASMRVVSTDPADGAGLVSSPPVITVNFALPLAAASLTAGDLKIDGQPASAVSVLGTAQARFTIGSTLGVGQHTVSIAAGAVQSTTGEQIEAYQAKLYVLAQPSVSEEAIVNTDQNGVRLRARVAHLPRLRAYYGVFDGGPFSTTWERSIDLGTFEDGIVEPVLYGLEPNTTYFVRLFAENAVGTAWSTQTLSFRTAAAYTPIDSNTTALWLFDEEHYPNTNLIDAGVDQYDLRLSDAGRIVAGRFGNALRCTPAADYNAYYSEWNGMVCYFSMGLPDGEPSGLWGPTITPGLVVQSLAPNQPWTFECWIKLSAPPANRRTLIDLGQAYLPGFSVQLDPQLNTLVVSNAYAGQHFNCPVNVAALANDAWHHVAFSRAVGVPLRVYVDGVAQSTPSTAVIAQEAVPAMAYPPSLATTDFDVFDATKEYERFRANRFNIALGEDRQGDSDLDCVIDEVRFSRVARYTAPFNAARSHAEKFATVAQPPSQPSGPPLLFGPGGPAEPLPLGSRKHVFIDDAIVATATNLTLQLNPVHTPQGVSVHMTGDQPFIDKDGYVYVLSSDSYGSAEGITRVYRSVDGLTFSPAIVGEHLYSGTTYNNIAIIRRPMYFSIFEDTNPATPARQRYKLHGWPANRGIAQYYSADLLHWRRAETQMIPVSSGGGAEGYWDDQQGLYRTLVKRDGYSGLDCEPSGGRVSIGFETRNVLGAWPFKALFQPFYAGGAVAIPTCEGPIVFPVTAAGQVYRSRVMKYPWAPDVYLAFIWRFPTSTYMRQTELAVSRDGINWTMTADQGMYMPNGGTYAGQTVMEAVSQNGMIRRGDELWQYAEYGMTDHNTSGADYDVRLKQRLDGFRSYDAGATTGTLTTRLLRFEGNRLVLNTAVQGSLRVALLQQNGQPFPGFSLADCDAVKTNSTAVTVQWKGSDNVQALAGQTLRVQFELRSGKLYAFQFVDDNKSGVQPEAWRALD